MVEKKKIEPDDKVQCERFIDTVKHINADTDKEEFDKTCTQIFKTKKTKKDGK